MTTLIKKLFRRSPASTVEPESQRSTHSDDDLKMFSDNALWVMAKMNQNAQMVGCEYMTSCHLLAAIAEHPHAAFFSKMESPPSVYADAIERSRSAPFREDLRSVLLSAIEAAKAQQSRQVELDHLVSALLKYPALASFEVMQKHGVKPAGLFTT